MFILQCVHCNGAAIDCVTNGMMPRVNKIINTVAHITYWSIINAAVIVYVLSCDRVNSSRGFND